MHAPQFWHRPSTIGKLLSPLSLLWRSGSTIHTFLNHSPWSSPVPVLCIGNITAGGAGKTPLAIDFIKALIKIGHKPHVLTRGYGGSLKGPIRVNPSNHTVSEVGDEPLLIASTAPTWVAKNRVLGAKQAIKNGASVIVMDDGFQNETIKKTFSILTIDGGYGFGNGQIIPAGPLRETPNKAINRCNAIVLVGDDCHGILDYVGKTRPIYETKIIAHPNPELADKKVLAFSGIGRPSKFFESVRELGYEIVGTYEFPDHHQFRSKEIKFILEQALSLSAIPITTTKDFVRLPPETRPKIKTIKISVEWKNIDDRETIIKRTLGYV